MFSKLVTTSFLIGLLMELFSTFFLIGAFTFGGGYAMIPLIQEAVLKKGWIDSTQLVDFIAVAESTPGPFAVNIATYIGIERAGIVGAVFATLGVVLPSFIVILIVATVFEKFKTSKLIKGIMSGLKPAVIGLIGSAVLSIGKTAFIPDGIENFSISALVSSALIFLVAAFLEFKKKIHPILVILVSALLGIAFGYMGLY